MAAAQAHGWPLVGLGRPFSFSSLARHEGLKRQKAADGGRLPSTIYVGVAVFQAPAKPPVRRRRQYTKSRAGRPSSPSKNAPGSGTT
jgi:hypothetical protein